MRKHILITVVIIIGALFTYAALADNPSEQLKKAQTQLKSLKEQAAQLRQEDNQALIDYYADLDRLRSQMNAAAKSKDRYRELILMKFKKLNEDIKALQERIGDLQKQVKKDK